MGWLILILSGLAAGGIHVLSGPDHLAAVLPMLIGKRIKHLQVALLWGIGHGSGVLVLGLIGLLTRHTIPLDPLSNIAEFIVGGLLVVLGIWSIYRSRHIVVHSHHHEHDEASDTNEANTIAEPHTHPHIHINDKTVDHPDHSVQGDHQAHNHSVLGFGLLHGLAGAGHLFGVLPSLALPLPQAATYLGTYLLGSIAAMIGFAFAARLFLQDESIYPLALRLSGTAALILGLFWMAKTIA